MKRIILTFVLMLLVASTFARTFVLVTGVSRYENEAANLAQTTKDAKSFYEVMKTQTNDVTILTSKYANHDNILSKLKTLASAAKEGDRIIFFFSGHGGPGCICSYDRDIEYVEIINVLAKSKASEKICFVDACHAGSVQSASNSYGMTSDNGMIFFMSSRADEYSQENAMVGAGYFTQGLIKGLRGKADDNKDRKITIYELFKYAYNDVLSRSSTQHPQLIAPKSCLQSVVAKW